MTQAVNNKIHRLDETIQKTEWDVFDFSTFFIELVCIGFFIRFIII